MVARPLLLFAVLSSIPALAPAQAPTWRWIPGLESGPGVSTSGVMTFASARGETVLVDRAELWLWDGLAWHREQAPPYPHYRYDIFGLVSYDAVRDRILLLQGGTGEMWEHDGDRWSKSPVVAPQTLQDRSGAAAAYDEARARLVYVGGGKGGVEFADTWEYDGASWTAGAPAPPAMTGRQRHRMTYDSARQCTVLFGGQSASTDLGDTWELDAAGWRAGAQAPFVTSRHQMVYDAGRARTIVLLTDALGVNVLWEYDGAGWQQGAAPPPSFDPRIQVAMAYDDVRDRLVLHGGIGLDSEARMETWEVDPSGTWRRAHADVDTARERYLPFLAYDEARDRVVAVSGFPTQDCWEYDGEHWDPGVPMPSVLQGRFFPAFAYDRARARSVFFAGHHSYFDEATNHDDTWYYDGTSWQLGPTAPAGLVPRGCHMMSYDSARQVMVMFGGDSGASSLDDTWELGGSGWTAGPAAPPGLAPREYHVMAFDELRSVTVMWGGDSDSGTFDDTWEYDGSAWTPGAPTPPALTFRFGQGFAFHPGLGRILMVGGDSLTGLKAEGWLYDGTAWVPGDDLPEPKGPASMVWDSARSRMLLFGGGNPNDERGMYEYCAGCVGGDDSAAGAGPTASNEARLRLFTTDGVRSSVDIAPYAAGGFGLQVGAGDIDALTTDEALTGPGPGPVYGPQARAFRSDGTAVAKVNFFAYGTLKYGVKVRSGALDVDAPREMLTGAGPGGVFGPHVRGWNFDGGTLAALARINFFAYATLRFGVNVAAGDVDDDGFGELVTGPGPGVIFAPQVRGFDHDGGAVTAIAKINFFAFATTQYGALVASASVDPDVPAEIVAAPGPGPTASFPARVLGFDYDASSVAPLPGYDVTAFPTLYGATVGTLDEEDDGRHELLAGAGPDPAAAGDILAYRYASGGMEAIEGAYRAFGLASHGAQAAGGDFGL